MRTNYRLRIDLPFDEDTMKGIDPVVLTFEAHSDESAKNMALELLTAYPTWQYFALQREAWDGVQSAYRGISGRTVVEGGG